ncbi:MAG: DUF1614 domain-containing protein [Clostridia bacterium]
MSVGLILLIVVAVLILFGVAQRVLDKLRLSDTMALVFVALIFVGGLIGDIPIGSRFTINLGGAVVPIALCVYLLIKAGTPKEFWRAIIATLVTGGAVWALGHYLPNEPEAMPFDINYLYGLAAGVIAYVCGRSRRSAFVAGVMGVTLADVGQAVLNWSQGIDQTLQLGGAGAVDVIVIAGLTAVLLAELIGEVIERMARRKNPDPERAFEDGEFVRGAKRK